MKRLVQVGVSVFIYLLFFLEMGFIYQSINVCPFERNVKALKLEGLRDVTEKYYYEIEERYTDTDDLVGMTYISGWLVRENEEQYTAVPVELILKSEDAAYRIRSYAKQRTDIGYLDQGKPNNNLSAGYTALFPLESVEAGEYEIGFMLEENGKSSVLWTDEWMDIEAIEAEAA